MKRRLCFSVERARPCSVKVANIEDHQAIKNLDEIARESEVMIIARGDLGIEVPYGELAISQRGPDKYF